MVSKPFWWIVASRTACFGYPIAPRYFRDFKPTLRGAKSLSWRKTGGERELHHFIILSMKIRHEFMVIWGHLRCFPDIFFSNFLLGLLEHDTVLSCFSYGADPASARTDDGWGEAAFGTWTSTIHSPSNPKFVWYTYRMRVFWSVFMCFLYILHYTSYIFIILFKMANFWDLISFWQFFVPSIWDGYVVGLCSRLKNRNLHFPNGNFWIPKSLSAICSGDFSLILSKVSGIPGRELPPPPPPARKTKWTCSACGTMNFETWTYLDHCANCAM